MHRLSANFVLGYHGCSKQVAKKLLGGAQFKKSSNDYDWLGHGVYFWEANPLRGLEFAREALKRKGEDSNQATVVGAVIELGLCLDLTTSIGVSQVKQAHQALSELIENKAYDPPKNSKDQLRRNLDCAVIQMLHKIREQSDEPQIDTVRGLFLEGQPLYETAGFHDKTHIQLAVRSLECIKGVFRVPASQLTD